MSTKKTLKKYAEIANARHGKVLIKLRSSIKLAREAGDALNKAKKLVKHGEWTDWLEDNFHASHETARVYMRIAREWSNIAHHLDGSKFTIEEARRMLKDTWVPDKDTEEYNDARKI